MQRPESYFIAEGLFTLSGSEPHLIGGHCKTCGRYFFPKFSTLHSPQCKLNDVEEVLLSRKGKLLSYTILYSESPPPYRGPDPFAPYGIGLITLSEGINVVGILTGIPVEEIRTGTEYELVVEKLYTDESGKEVLTWKFKPAS